MVLSWTRALSAALGTAWPCRGPSVEAGDGDISVVCVAEAGAACMEPSPFTNGSLLLQEAVGEMHSLFQSLRCFMGIDWVAAPNDSPVASGSCQIDRLHKRPRGGLAVSSYSGEYASSGLGPGSPPGCGPARKVRLSEKQRRGERGVRERER